VTYNKDEIHKLAIKAGFHWEYALDEANEIAALVSIVRAEALEEAAEWCDRLANNGSLDAEDCAAAIRGLK
jgi:hypothetical protein